MKYSELEHVEGESSEQTLSSEAPDEGCMQMQESKRGGWKAFPYIIGSEMGLSLASTGWGCNLTVYLITVFNIKSIRATQISSIVSGSSFLFPIAGAILADSFLGSFSVITIFSMISLLGMILITLTASVNFLHPPPCTNASLVALYTGIALASLGAGGTGITVATMGADQFQNNHDKNIFFNWYFVISYACIACSSTVVVYIQDKINWGLGFGVCVAANLTGFMVFLSGMRYYHHVKPKESPFASIARVVVAAIMKRNAARNNCYFYGSAELSRLNHGPTTDFSFLNNAALKLESNNQSSDLLIEKRSWKHCTVEEVEDLKTLLRIVPLWSSSILLSATIGVFISLILLEALTMDKHFGKNFEVPAASFLTFNILSTCVSLSILDRLVFPWWQKLTGDHPTPLQRIGVGHLINIIALVGSAIVENQRLQVVKKFHLDDQPGSEVPMSAFWLGINLTIIGISEALHYPGQVAFYYQEFPESLRNTATAMISLIVGIGFYSSAVVIGLVRRATDWLPDDINAGRADYVYGIMAGIGMLNFAYYLICAKSFNYCAAVKLNVHSVT
ncbi:protein NRT1/ PTR FAMILY 2.7 [Daucus carota subsp. sativus]|uniref:Major facilitator superfamily (MFS) profile domain-containing protein n=2 Tax=Daucus carota subsp. sativus TaxID=79200 RepID=A0A166DSX2_DAUCS|nr:PREDICTED: protein NRT1/ PTR FAMILY 2.7-like [Daucus carota subsp. sativus]XP_017231645.1 PREDICTED: protein NRT1/ PTR FAMILY 2.7-like [Daucus carota subsp. sativus]